MRCTASWPTRYCWLLNEPPHHCALLPEPCVTRVIHPTACLRSLWPPPIRGLPSPCWRACLCQPGPTCCLLWPEYFRTTVNRTRFDTIEIIFLFKFTLNFQLCGSSDYYYDFSTTTVLFSDPGAGFSVPLSCRFVALWLASRGGVILRCTPPWSSGCRRRGSHRLPLSGGLPHLGGC